MTERRSLDRSGNHNPRKKEKKPPKQLRFESMRFSQTERLKTPLTASQWGAGDNQAKAQWQRNEYEAKQEIAQERTKQPLHPRNEIPLTREPKRPRFQGGFAAGGQAYAARWFNKLSTDEQNQAHNYWDEVNVDPWGAMFRHPEGYALAQAYQRRTDPNYQSDNEAGPSHQAEQEAGPSHQAEASSQYEQPQKIRKELRDALRALMTGNRVREDDYKAFLNLCSVDEASQCIDFLENKEHTKYNLSKTTFKSRKTALNYYRRQKENS